MSGILSFPDVMFDSEPIGLADDLVDLESPLNCIIESDEVPEAGGIIYFGLPTDIGETIEVRAEVIEVEPTGDVSRIQVRVVAADARLIVLAETVLSGAGSSPSDGSPQPQWARGLKQTNGTFAVIMDSPAGILTADQLAKVAELSRKGTGLVKLTHAQRILLLTTADQIGSVEGELASVGLRIGVLHHGVRNIRACCGALCHLCQGSDAVALAVRISEMLFGHPTQYDVKIAVSDCSRNCSEAYCSDIGLIGVNGKYEIVVGGRGSKVPFRAIRLVQELDADDAAETVVKIVAWYKEKARDKERVHALLERLGEDEADELDIDLPEAASASLSDGVDEGARLRSHLARVAGVKIAKTEIGLG